jgi:general secretion pathway protein I
LRTRRARRGEGGFTLIEVVVAFVLLALVFSVGFEIFSTGLARAGALDERSRALEVARSRLDDAGMEEALAEGAAQGESQDPRFHWTTTITRSEEGTDPDHPINSAYALFRVDVKVDWRGADAKDHSLALSTLQLGPRSR